MGESKMKKLDNKDLSKRLMDNYYKKFGTNSIEEKQRVKQKLEQFISPDGIENSKHNLKLEDHKHLFPIN